MSGIKALDELRTAARNMAKGRNLENHEECNLFLIIADEIEAEIAERYQLLPVDIDGVPIHVGDRLELGGTHGCVISLTYSPENELPWEWLCDSNGNWYNTKFTRHAEPRTVEDVLEDFLADYDDWDDGNTLRRDREKMRAELFEKYADEIRELLGGDAE